MANRWETLAVILALAIGLISLAQCCFTEMLGLLSVFIIVAAVVGQFWGCFDWVYVADKRWASRHPEPTRRAIVISVGLGIGLLTLIEPTLLALADLGNQHIVSRGLIIVGLIRGISDYGRDMARSASSELERWAFVGVLAVGIVVTPFIFPSVGELLMIEAWLAIAMSVPIVIWQDEIREWLKQRNS